MFFTHQKSGLVSASDAESSNTRQKHVPTQHNPPVPGSGRKSSHCPTQRNERGKGPVEPPPAASKTKPLHEVPSGNTRPEIVASRLPEEAGHMESTLCGNQPSTSAGESAIQILGGDELMACFRWLTSPAQVAAVSDIPLYF